MKLCDLCQKSSELELCSSCSDAYIRQLKHRINELEGDTEALDRLPVQEVEAELHLLIKRNKRA